MLKSHNSLNSMNKLIILDFTTGEVDIYPIESIPGKDFIVDEQFINYLGHSPNNSQWMVFDGNITFHKEVLK